MKFNFRFRRLCGAYYGHPTATSAPAGGGNGSNILFTASGDTLISAVSNRVQVLDLKTHTVRTMSCESRSNIRCMALSPNNVFLFVVDAQNYALLIHFHRSVVLHRFRFKKRVRRVAFSPNGRYLAISQGKHVQVWLTPSNDLGREVSPLVLHRTFTGQSDDVISIEWSSDSTVIVAGSRDSTARIWTVHTTRNFFPVTLSGHKSGLVGAYFSDSAGSTKVIDHCYTVSEDGALATWNCSYGTSSPPVMDGSDDVLVDDAHNFFVSGPQEVSDLPSTQARQLVKGRWSMHSRHYFHQEGSIVTSTSYCPGVELLVVAFSSGLFGLYELPSVANIHTLSIGSGQSIKTAVLNGSGDWLALGCPSSQQLLVWEWRSETYVLKQRGHAYGMRCMAYSPDGVVICTGGEDGKLKLWNSDSGFCYVTMEKSHTAPVTAVTFAKPSVVLSTSLDGTVQAHDLHRYRTFKTFTTPTPVQFLSLAVDPSGEIVAAGSTEPFHIYVWNLQTGKLLDVLTGHEAPVCALAFQSNGGVLASTSWDGSLKLWEIYKGNVPTDTAQHTSEVVAVAFRPDGKEVCTATIGGLLSFWDVEDAKLKFEIDGRRDITGGRKMNDRMTSDNNAASRYFTSVCYSADGACVLAGGNSKYVCIYEVSQQILLKKFQVTYNRSLDGVLDKLHSRNLGDGGPVDEEADPEDESNYGAVVLPGAVRGDDGSRKSRVEVLTRQVAFSSTGREWAAVSGEGLHVFSLDDELVFDPIALTESITPQTILTRLLRRDFGGALRMAIHLNEPDLVYTVLEKTPYRSITMILKNLGAELAAKLCHFLATKLESSPHLEFYLHWCLELLQIHGSHFNSNRISSRSSLQALHKVVLTRHNELKDLTTRNRYTLEFLETVGS